MSLLDKLSEDEIARYAAWLDGTLDPAEVALVETELEQNGKLRAELTALREDEAMYRDLRPRLDPSPFASIHPYTKLLGAAAAFLVLGGALFFLARLLALSGGNTIRLGAVISSWQLARVDDPGAEPPRLIRRAIRDGELLDFIGSQPATPERIASILETAETLRGPAGSQREPSTPRGTVVGTRPSFRFEALVTAAEPYEHILIVYGPGTEIRRFRIDRASIADGVVTYRVPRDQPLAAGAHAPLSYRWTVIAVPEEEGRPELGEEHSVLEFALVTPEFRDALLEQVAEGLPTTAERVLRAYALMQHGLAAAVVDELEPFPPTSPPEWLRMRELLLGRAYATLGDHRRVSEVLGGE